jgi:hypothetical protein
MTVTWKKNGLRLVVLGITEMADGRAAYSVCKEGASRVASFKVPQEDVEADFK